MNDTDGFESFGGFPTLRLSENLSDG